MWARLGSWVRSLQRTLDRVHERRGESSTTLETKTACTGRLSGADVPLSEEARRSSDGTDAGHQASMSGQSRTPGPGRPEQQVHDRSRRRARRAPPFIIQAGCPPKSPRCSVAAPWSWAPGVPPRNAGAASYAHLGCHATVRRAIQSPAGSLAVMTRLVIDTNAVRRGTFSTGALRQWIDVVQMDATEIYLPEVVIWEWAEHAASAHSTLQAQLQEVQGMTRVCTTTIAR